jgi:protein-tyrosine phosphatase
MKKKLAKYFPLVHNTLKKVGLSNLVYKKNVEPINHIINNIYLGDFRAGDDLNILKEYNITHIINCAFNLPNKFPNDITYKRLDLRDEPDQPIIEKMKEAYDFIKENKDHNIFVHCVFGKSRSGSVVIFYVMNELKMDFNSARDYVKNIRDIVDPNEGFKNELNKYYEQYILPLKKESEKEKETEKENVKESEKQKESENENMNKINIQ